MMEFLCPNGHRIQCQTEHAGRAAKCPRCGVKFRIPQPTDRDVSESEGSDSSFSKPEFIESTGSSRKLPSNGAAGQKEPEIEFLCPNGHRLHGVASLQGKPGECPECGSRFRIPVYEDVPPEEKVEQEIQLGHADGQGSDAEKHAGAVEHEPRHPASTAGQPMAGLVGRLWDMKPNGAKLELRLRDGEIVVPDRFLKKLSHQSHQGVFAVKEANGAVSLVAIAWDTVARATVRGLSELPKGLSE